MKSIAAFLIIALSSASFAGDPIEGTWRMTQASCSNSGPVTDPNMLSALRSSVATFKGGKASISMVVPLNGQAVSATQTANYALSGNKISFTNQVITVNGQRQNQPDDGGQFTVTGNSLVIVDDKPGQDGDICAGQVETDTYQRQ